MAYTTYGFYTDTYYGNTVDSLSFPKWNDRASDKLNYICDGRIDDDVLEEYSTQIQKATCSLIDLLYRIDVAENNTNNPQIANVKSMSSGGQSITFGNNDTTISKAMSSLKEQDRLAMDTVFPYLRGTNLVYMGI